MRPALACCVLLLACRGGDKAPAPADSASPGPGTTAPLPDDLAVSCPQQLGNVLRRDCVVTSRPAGPLTFTFQEQGVDGASDGPVRTLSFPEVADEHRFTLSGLVADTEYTWFADNTDRTVTGSFTVGPAPQGFPEVFADGTASFSYVLFALGTRLFVCDVDGRIVWYQDASALGDEPMAGLVSGYDWTGDGVVYHITSTLRRVGLDGAERLALDRGVDFDKVLHSDVFWDGSRIWSLNADLHDTPQGQFVADGFYGFDDSGVVAEWSLTDHLLAEPAPTGDPTVLWDGLWPGAEDLGQANSIHVRGDTVVLSFRALSSVWALEGPDEPDFGAVRWRMDGQGGGDFALSGGVTGSGDFLGQNHARLHGDRLTLFDNRTGSDARSLVYAVDPAAGTADVVNSQLMSRPCDLLGATYELDNGSVVATCANSHEVMEWPAGAPEDSDPTWILWVETNQPWMARGIPITQSPAGW